MKAQGKLCTVDPNTCRFCVCEFAYSLKLTCSLKINARSAFQSFADMHRVVKSLSHPRCTVPSRVELGGYGSAVPGARILGLFSGT